MITKGVKKIIILLVIIVTGILSIWLLVQNFIRQGQQPDQSAQDEKSPFTKQVPNPRTNVS